MSPVRRGGTLFEIVPVLKKITFYVAGTAPWMTVTSDPLHPGDE